MVNATLITSPSIFEHYTCLIKRNIYWIESVLSACYVHSSNTAWTYILPFFPFGTDKICTKKILWLIQLIMPAPLGIIIITIKRVLCLVIRYYYSFFFFYFHPSMFSVQMLLLLVELLLSLFLSESIKWEIEYIVSFNILGTTFRTKIGHRIPCWKKSLFLIWVGFAILAHFPNIFIQLTPRYVYSLINFCMFLWGSL